MKMSLHSQHLSTEISTQSTQSSQSSILCDYEVQQTIGSGNFGKVKLGIYKPTNKKVAIKILSKEKIKKKNEMKIVERELDILPSFNHVNVIHFSKCVEDNLNIYIIMDYCELGELFDYIVSKTKLSEDETACFFYQIINGVDYIHSKGVSHRDLKPENLLLTKNKLLKIVDFGLASTSANQNTLGTRCGSPSYASPELLRGKKYNGYKTDIWSCGIILYAMICGYLPFDGRNNDELFKLIIKGNVEYPASLSETIKKILKRMLVVNPENRISISDIKKDNLYLRGKKLFEEQFGFDPNLMNPNNSNANLNSNNGVSGGNNHHGLCALDSQINSFRKKMNNFNDHSKAKETDFRTMHSNNLNNNTQKHPPILMVHLQTEPDVGADTSGKAKITPFNCLYNTKDNKKKDTFLKTELYPLHRSVDTNISNNNSARNTKNVTRRSNTNSKSKSHSKNKSTKSNQFGAENKNNNPIKPNPLINRLINGITSDLRDKESLIKFPFQNYVTKAASRTQSLKKKANIIFNSISYEDNQKKQQIKTEILPKLIPHY